MKDKSSKETSSDIGCATLETPIRVAQIMGKYRGGGVEAVILNYCQHIDRDKIQFDFLFDEDSSDIPYAKIEQLGGKVILIPSYTKPLRYAKALKYIFKENRYKIVHSNINTLSVFPLRAAKKSGVPVRIAHSHSTSNKKEHLRNLIKNILRPFSKVYATHYFACSELAGRYQFGNKAFDDGKVTIIPNAIDFKKFKFNERARNRIRKEYGISEDTFIIGHIGRFNKQKNHTFLIDIFNEFHKQHKNSVLMLAGSGPLETEIREKVKNLHLEDTVIFLGQYEKANELYSAFDVFVLPSLYEGLPVVGVEAQANGLPCVFSDTTTKDVSFSQKNIFVALKATSKAWARTIHRQATMRHERIAKPSSLFNITVATKKMTSYYLDGELA